VTPVETGSVLRGFVLAMAAPANSQISPWVQFVPFALVGAIFYFIILLPMRKRQKKVQEFLNHLKVGDRIVTTGGMYGSITKLNDKSVQVQIAEKVRIEIARSAVGGYQGQEPVVQGAAAD